MRILVANHHRQRAGGTEAYLDGLLPALDARGVGIAFLHEAPPGENAIGLPPGAPSLCVARMGLPEAIAAARRFAPDLVFHNGVSDPRTLAALASLAPLVHFAHNYYGTCVSGEKLRKWPAPVPCERRFGAACLLAYLPERCGGLSPVTMLRQYRIESARLDLLGRAAAIVANSTYIRGEYVRHGFPPDRVFTANLFVAPGPEPAPAPDLSPACRLLYTGRMVSPKGGAMLLDALEPVARRLDRPVEVTFAGDGPERAGWRKRAAAIRDTRVTVRFEPWVSPAGLRRLAASHHVLVMPSLWPEPFGLVGLELGAIGLPTAAFASGGIPDWLTDGENGHLAPNDPPRPEALAEAVARCFQSEPHYRRLREGAAARAREFNADAHLDRLLPVFHSVVSQ